MRNYKKVKEVPQEFLQFLELIRETAAFELPNFKNLLSREVLKLNDASSAEAEYQAELAAARQLLREIKKHELLSGYVCGATESAQDEDIYIAAISKYQAFFENRNKLKALVRRLGAKHANKTLPTHAPQVMFTAPQTVVYDLLPGGLLKVRPVEKDFFDGINTTRLKRCVACKNVFYAKKVNAETCGLKQCANVLAQRKYQTKNKTELSETRKANYAQKKKSEELRKKKLAAKD